MTNELMFSNSLLRQRQSLPLDAKIKLTQNRIRQWYEHWQGMAYVAFSGGKDSTVLLSLVREMYRNVPGVFCDTGLEYPEIREFVADMDNIQWVKPLHSFKAIIERYGFPVVSKQVSMGLARYHLTGSEFQKELRLNGGICPASGKWQTRSIPKKYHYLVNAPFKCSDECCRIMKKDPSKKYERQSGRKPMIGTMTSDSFARQNRYLKFGCNGYKMKQPNSMPLAFWTENDIWEYLRTTRTKYCKIYDMGEKHTGCMFCMFGIQNDSTPNRFQRMRKTHPVQWNYCIYKLGLGEVLDFMNVPYK